MIAIQDSELHSVRKIFIEYSFSQTDDEGGKKSFAGTMKVGGVLFEYHVTFVSGFSWDSPVEAKRIMERLMFTPEGEVERVRNDHFGLDMAVHGQSVQLSNREYAFFASHILPFGGGFFCGKESCQMEKLKKAAANKKIEASGIQTITSAALVTVTDEEVALLRAKFNCKI